MPSSSSERANSSSSSGRIFLLDLEELDAVVRVLAGEFLGLVVVGQGERELVRAAALEADQLVEEAGQGDDAALDDGELGALLDVRLLLALDGHGHVDAHRVVPLHRAIDRLEGGVAPPQIRHRLVDLRLVDGHLVARHAQRLVGADLDRRADGHCRLDDQRLGRLELDLGLGDRVDRLGFEGFVVDGREQVLDRLLEHQRLPDGAARRSREGPCRAGSRECAPAARACGSPWSSTSRGAPARPRFRSRRGSEEDAQRLRPRPALSSQQPITRRGPLAAAGSVDHR